MITALEKELLENECVEYLTDAFYGNVRGKVAFKLISNVLKRYIPTISLEFDEKLLQNKELFKENMEDLIRDLLEIEENVTVKEYTTGQLATFFGVSITSINKWIEQGRFKGIKRSEHNKQIRIPDTTVYISPSGGTKTIRQVAEMWQKEQEKFKETTIEGEIAALEDTIKFFEKKYGGKYEVVLKNIENKTDEQLRDEEEWAFVLERLAEVKNDKS